MTTRPAGSGTQCIDRAPRSRRGVEHTPRMQFEDFSGLAQHDAAPGAMVEFRAQFLLERLDLLAQDRLADLARGRAPNSRCRSFIAGSDRSAGVCRGEIRIGLRVVAQSLR